MKLAKFFSNYFTVRLELLDAVRELTQGQLDWKNDNHPNSIGWLLAHIAECEYYWIDVAARGKDGPGDFERFEKAQKKADILALLDEGFETLSDYLQEEDIDDWDEVFYEVEGEEKVSKRWLVWHVVEHQARHRGQIFMLMRMQNLQVPHV
jgi:uncharacterized damage-inducible protein DinB